LKGPKVDAPQAALDGFLRKTGLMKDQLKVEKTPKGDVYLAVIARKGRDTAQVLAEILPEALAKLPWPKSMRFPDSAVRWVRPLHAIVATFDGEVVPFEFAGVASGNVTSGHRFLSSGPITVRRFDDYVDALRKAHVVLDAEERKAIIFEGVKQAAFVHGLEMILDEALLDEVAGLAEYPQVLIGAIEDQFMDVPPEILQTSMRTHQKYFSLRDPKTGKMANRFALVAATVASDGGREIVAGNERVLRARLSDAKFFWDQDRKRTLESRVEDLKGIVFHAKLGTQYERVERIEALAGEIAEKIGADMAKAKRAARLCKADLTTGVVGEFPELQGVMGDYYAEHDGEPKEVYEAIQEHYMPKGTDDLVPAGLESCAVGLADRLHTLVGFFAIDERPTGSSDPYALRRAAISIIRIVQRYAFRLCLADSIRAAYLSIQYDNGRSGRALGPIAGGSIGQSVSLLPLTDVTESLLAFFADRLAVSFKNWGVLHDRVQAIFSLGHEDDLTRLLNRVEALQSFLKTDEGANLLAGYKRAANILKAEEKKDKTTFGGEPDPEALTAPEEKALYVELATASEMIRAEVERERFVEAMGVMARLRAPVDAFFDKVTVNDKDARLRENRLKLLARLRATLHQVADFSKIEG